MSLHRATRSAFFAHSALTQVVTFVVRPTATYRAIELNVPNAWLGILGASFAVVPLLLALPSGRAVDQYGERTVMLTGGGVMTGACLVIVLASERIETIVLGCALLGLGQLCCVVAQQAMVANQPGESSYDRVFGHYTFAASMGQALGPVLISVLGGGRTIPDTRTIFWSSVVLSLLLVTLSVVIRPQPVIPPGTSIESGQMRTLLRTQGLLRALAVSSVVLAAVDITLVYLPALGAEREIAAGAIGVLLTVRAASSMVSRLFLGGLVARFGRRRVLVVSIALAAAMIALSAVPLPIPALVLVVALLGLGLGAGQPITMSWLAESAPPGLRGRAMSLRLTGNRIGQVIFPSLAGLMAAGAGAGGVLVLTAFALSSACYSARRVAGQPIRSQLADHDTPTRRLRR